MPDEVDTQPVKPRAVHAVGDSFKRIFSELWWLTVEKYTWQRQHVQRKPEIEAAVQLARRRCRKIEKEFSIVLKADLLNCFDQLCSSFSGWPICRLCSKLDWPSLLFVEIVYG